MKPARGWVSALFGGFSIRGAEVASKFALYMLAARLMGAEACGLMFLAMSWGSLAATVARLGADRGASRLVAAALAVGQGREARTVLVRAASITLGAGLVIGAATALAAPAAAAYLLRQPAAEPCLYAAAFLIPSLSIAVTLDFALIGLGRTAIAQLLQNLTWPVSMLAALLAGVRSAPLMLLVMAASQAASVLAALAVMAAERHRLRTNGPLPADEPPLPSLKSTAGPLFIVELVQMSLVSLPTLMLGVAADPKAVSVFSIAQRASMLILVVLLSVSVLAAPRYAVLHKLRDWATLATVNRRTQLAGLVFGGGLCLALALLAGTFLSLLGGSFVEGRAVLLILLAGQAVNALYAAQDYVLMMTGQGSALRAINLGQFIVMISLSALLIPLTGASGAAIATAMATATGAIGTAMVVKLYYPEAAPILALGMPRGMAAYFQRRKA